MMESLKTKESQPQPEEACGLTRAFRIHSVCRYWSYSVLQWD